MEGTPPTTGPATPEETLPIGAATAVAMMPETTTSEPPEAIGTAPISTDTHSAETGPVEPPTSESDDANDEVLTVAMVDDSVALRQRARDIADDRLARETQKGGGFRGLLRRVWKGSVAEPYYSRKYYHQALDSIQENDSMFGADRRASRISASHTVDRFVSEYESETVHTEAGERKTVLDNSAEGQHIKAAVRDLLGSFARGDIDEEGFAAERLRVLDQLSHDHPELMGEGLLYADNLLDIAQQVRARAEHGQSIEDTLDRMQFIVGEARSGVRTEAQLARADRFVQRLHETKAGSLVSETTLGAVVGVGLAIGKQLTRKTIGSAMAVPGLTGLSTGLFAGLRESKKLKTERAQHGREMAQGGQINRPSQRRDQLEEFRAETVAALDLGQSIEAIIGVREEAIAIETEDQAMDLLRALSDADWRVKLSDQSDLDLIHFSDVTAVEGERMYLDTAIARAKIALRRFAGANPDSTIAQLGGVDSVLSDMLTARRTVQDAEVAQLDAQFNSFRRKTALKAAVVGGVVGAAFGLAMQEGYAHIPGLGDHTAGIGETAKPGEHTTLLGGMGLAHHARVPSANGVIDHKLSDQLSFKTPKGWQVEQHGNHINIVDAKGHIQRTIGLDDKGMIDKTSLTHLQSGGDHVSHVAAQGPNGSAVELRPGGHGSIVLPEHFTVKNIDPTHSVITGPDGKTISLELNPDGSLTTHALDQLHAAGLHVTDKAITVNGPPDIRQVDGNGLAFINADKTRFIHRTDWYNNNTPKFDLNELKAWAGGENGSWFDHDGNVVIDVTHMTSGGSFNTAHSVNPFSIVDGGQLHLGVSATRETQAHVFDFVFHTQPDGKVVAIIPKDNPAHQFFGMDSTGHRTFSGKYFEVLHDTGQMSPNGAANVRPLATYVGTGQGTFNVPVPTTEIHHITSIDIPGRDIIDIKPPTVEVHNPIDTFPIIPLRSRAGLERLGRRPEYYGGYYSEAELDEFEREISPRLREDPDARLETGRELEWYRRQIEERRGRDYLDEIDRDLESTPELASLPSNTRAMVVIPVRGSTEADNIEGVLSLYAQQDEAALRATTVLLDVNFTDEEMGDPAKVAEIDRTLAAIDTAKTRFPQLRVAVVKQELKTEEITGPGRGAIGLVARRMYDTAMMAVERAVRNGEIPADQDVLLIRKDADEQGMSADFLPAYFEAAESKPETDVFQSHFRWQTALHRRFPGLAMLRRYEISLEAASGRVAESRGELHHNKTIGIVTAARMSTLASVGSIGFGEYTGAGSDDLDIGERIFTARRGLIERRGPGYGRGHRRRGSRSLRSSESGIETEPRRVIERVPRAEVDTHSGRLLRRYVEGLPIADAWSDFDAGGGYRSRTSAVGSSDAVIDRDDVANDPAGVAQRIAAQISASSSHRTTDRSAVSLALHRMFARNHTRDGSPIYKVSWRGSQCTFEFTDEGVKWLQNYLLRDLHGRYDNLGGRTRRKLYNEAPGAKRPRRPEPLMVQPI